MDEHESKLLHAILDRLTVIENKIGDTSNSTAPVGARLTWVEDQLDVKTDINKTWFNWLKYLSGTQNDLIKIIKDMGDYFEQHVERLNEAYYHLFPDREAQDNNFIAQMNQILREASENKFKPDEDNPRS